MHKPYTLHKYGMDGIHIIKANTDREAIDDAVIVYVWTWTDLRQCIAGEHHHIDERNEEQQQNRNNLHELDVEM